MKLKKGDKVKILSGKDKNREGKILNVFPLVNKILVEGINLRKKHRRARKEGEKGSIISFPAPFDASKAMLICSKCGKPTRIGARQEGSEKLRICKKCSQAI